MSLRARLMLSIVAVMIATMTLSVVIVIWNGRHQVHTELAAALAVANDSVRGSDAFMAGQALRPGDVAGLVATFDGARNVQAQWRGARGQALGVSTTLKPGYPAPSWFVGLLSPHLGDVSIPVGTQGAFAGQIVLRAFAQNEVSEVWANLSEDFLFEGIFFLLSALFIYRTANWLVAPVGSLSTAMADLRRGRNGGRIAAIGPRELRRLIDEFNGLASDLSASEAQTQALEDQLARLQEEERYELSRNLHDEVGPLLFLAKIDLLAVSRHPAIQADDELAKSIAAAARTLSSIQMSLRDVLNRLRPYEGLELGLARALEMLLAQWRARFKHIRFEFRIAGEPASIGERVQDCLYRIVQEAISNAVRHSQPSRIDVTLRTGPDKVEIGIANDGRVLAPADTNGLGLRTMRERAAGVGGVLIVDRGNDRRGWHVLARLPLFDMAESGAAATL